MAATDYEAVPAVDADARRAARRHGRDEVRRHLRRRPGEAEARRRAARRRARGRATASSASSRRWAARPTSCSPSPTQSRRRRTRASSTCSSRSASGSPARSRAMAIHDLGHEAISLTGSQAGIVTDTVHGKAKIVEVRARRIHEALDDGDDRARRRLPGRLDRVRGDDARPRRLRHDRGRARGRARRRPLRDLHATSTASSRPTRASSRARASSTRAQLRRDARDGRVGRRACSRRRSIEVARSHNVRLHVRSTFEDGDGTWIAGGGREMLEKALISGVVHQREETVYRVDGSRRARLFGALADASRERRHDRADGPRDRLLRPGRGHGRRGRGARRARRRAGARATTSAR